EGSCILPEIIAEEGICSLGSSRELPDPDPQLRHPDPAKGQHFGRWRQDMGPGMYFPGAGQYKPDRPRVATNRQTGKTRTIKYETPQGSRPRLIIPQRVVPILGDVSVPLNVTEGAK